MADKIALPDHQIWRWKSYYPIKQMLSAPKIRWRTAFTYALIIVFLMGSFGLYLSQAVSFWYRTSMEREWQGLVTRLANDPTLLAAVATVSTSSIDAPIPLEERRQLTTLVGNRATLLGARVTIFAEDGSMVADSHLSVMASQASSPQDLAAAAQQEDAVGQQYDALLGQDVVLFIRPLLVADKLLGYLQLSFPAHTYLPERATVRWWILSATMVVALLIVLMMVFQAERAAYTLRRLTIVAEQITKGNLSARTLSLSGGEVGQFVRAFNRMADKLQRQMEKRAREKDRLHTVLHVMTDGVLLLNRHNSVRLLNDAAANILKTTPERALRRSFVQTVRDHRIVEVFRRCQASGQTETAVIERTEDSVIRMVVTPFLRGKDRGHLVVLQDLTRMHQLQTARQDFVSNISHELRTPLASLRALVETLSDGALEDPTAARRFLHHMEVEVDALTQMVQELLELSRIESGKAKLQLASVNTATFLVQSCERLQAQSTRADVTLTVDVPDDIPAVQIDVTRMQQVLTNLVHNAIKFTPAGGSIQVTATANEAEQVTIAVTDTGVGIAHDDLARIFERFYKADRARSGGGTGLGLAIAKHIVQAHGGKIWAESLPGKGSTFQFTIPTVLKTEHS